MAKDHPVMNPDCEEMWRGNLKGEKWLSLKEDSKYSIGRHINMLGDFCVISSHREKMKKVK